MARTRIKADLVLFANDRLKRSGNQTITRSIEMFLKRGLRVLWITGVPPNYEGEAKPIEVFGRLYTGLTILRPNRAAGAAVRAVIRIKRAYGRASTSPRKRLGQCPLPKWYGANERRPYFGDESTAVSALRGIGWSGYQCFAHWVAATRVDWNTVRLVIGYEVFGARPAVAWGRRLRLPVMTKYQGTGLTPTQARLCPAFLLWYKWGLSPKSDLVVMENDGTNGLEVLRELGHDDRVIKFWMKGIDCKPVSSDSQEHDAIQFLSVSTFKPWKRLDRLLLSFRIARSRGLPSSARLTIVGDGAEGHSARRYAELLGLVDCVTFVGAVPHSLLDSYYRSCDALIICNDVSNLSNMVLEALSWGKPIISIDDGSTAELLEDGSSALLAGTYGDIGSGLADAICRFASDAELRRRLRAGALIACRSLESWHARMTREWRCILDLVPEWASRESR